MRREMSNQNKYSKQAIFSGWHTVMPNITRLKDDFLYSWYNSYNLCKNLLNVVNRCLNNSDN